MMYFYNNVRKSEIELAYKLKDWSLDDYNSFVQEYLLKEDFFENDSVELMYTEDEYKRPYIQITEYFSKKCLNIFVKTSNSFLFDDEIVNPETPEEDIIESLSNKKGENWFAWIVPKNFPVETLKRYIELKESNNVHAKIAFWEDLLDKFTLSRKKSAVEKEVKQTSKMLAQSRVFFKSFYSANDDSKVLIITANKFNTFNTLDAFTKYPNDKTEIKRKKFPLLNLELNSVEPDLDATISAKLNEQKNELSKAEKILLMIDDDREGKAVKYSIIKYFKNNHPLIFNEKKVECISFPEYVICGDEYDSFGIVANSIQSLSKSLEEWSKNSEDKILSIKKGINRVEEMRGYSKHFIDKILYFGEYCSTVE